MIKSRFPGIFDTTLFKPSEFTMENRYHEVYCRGQKRAGRKVESGEWLVKRKKWEWLVGSVIVGLKFHYINKPFRRLGISLTRKRNELLGWNQINSILPTFCLGLEYLHIKRQKHWSSACYLYEPLQIRQKMVRKLYRWGHDRTRWIFFLLSYFFGTTGPFDNTGIICWPEKPSFSFIDAIEYLPFLSVIAPACLLPDTAES